jgi:regulatory protein
MRLLARREHSTEELRRKLLGKGYPSETIEPVIQKLAGKRLVSDERFTANFIHHHAKRGQGPVRIRAALRQQGVADSQVDEALQSAAIDWVQLAREVRRRKFGAAAPRSLGERAKQARFLQYRGFDAEQLRAALRDQSGEGEDAPDITPDTTFEAE